MSDLPKLYVSTFCYRGTHILGVFLSLDDAKAACEKDAEKVVGKDWKTYGKWEWYDDNFMLDFNYYSYDVSPIQVSP